jgi:hypothetical protein
LLRIRQRLVYAAALFLSAFVAASVQTEKVYVT